MFGGSGRNLLDMDKVLKLAVKFTSTNTRCGQVLNILKCSTSATSSSKSPEISDVPGLSKNIVDVPTEEVGFPGASKKATYKNPEYFCYHNTSYFEAEVEMMKYRLPQPSNKTFNK